jgi:hypothetical protein
VSFKNEDEFGSERCPERQRNHYRALSGKEKDVTLRVCEFFKMKMILA